MVDCEDYQAELARGSHMDLRGVGACSPRKILETRCSEIASETIWDKARAVVPTCLAEYCIQFFAVHVCIC